MKYDGRQLYANVFEYKHSPAVYHVHFVDDSVEPRQIILHEENDRIIPDPAGKSNPELVEMVIEEILKNPNRV